MNRNTAKRILSLIVSTLLLSTCLSRGYAQNNIFPTTGNVGVGTSNPSYKLSVIGNISTHNTSNTNAVLFFGWLNDVARIRIGGSGAGARNGLDIQKSSDVSVMRILDNGNVGIGTVTPNVKLAVNGNIRAKEIKVEAINWPDYVFDNHYKLPDLSETETFVKKNKHLPGMPSAREVEEDGISLGDINRKLLEKVEELTLYLIEKDRQLKNQEGLFERQKQDLESLRAEVRQILNKNK